MAKFPVRAEPQQLSSAGRTKIAIGAIVIALLLISLGVIGLERFNATAKSSSESSARSIEANAIAENALYESSLQNQSPGSISGILRFYTNSSTIAWNGNLTSGTPFPNPGTFIGLSKIQELYSSINCYDWPPSVPSPLQFSNLTTRATGQGVVNSTFDITIKGTRPNCLFYQAFVFVQQEWTIRNGVWTIQKENWRFLTSSVYSSFGIPDPGAPPSAGQAEN